jgi:hypothetical protein
VNDALAELHSQFVAVDLYDAALRTAPEARGAVPPDARLPESDREATMCDESPHARRNDADVGAPPPAQIKLKER